MTRNQVIVISTPSGKISPVVVVLQPEHGSDAALDKAAALIRELTGRDPGAWTDYTGVTTIYASRAPAYPQPDAGSTDEEEASW